MSWWQWQERFRAAVKQETTPADLEERVVKLEKELKLVKESLRVSTGIVVGMSGGLTDTRMAE